MTLYRHVRQQGVKLTITRTHEAYTNVRFLSIDTFRRLSRDYNDLPRSKILRKMDALPLEAILNRWPKNDWIKTPLNLLVQAPET